MRNWLKRLALLIVAGGFAASVATAGHAADKTLRIGFQKYGTLDGTVDFISPDSVVVEGRPGAAYLVRVAVAGDAVGRGDLTGQVKLGMAGHAEIVTGEESLLKLLVNKIRQSISLK